MAPKKPAAKKANLTAEQIRTNYLESDCRLYMGVDSENEGKWAIFEGDPPSGAWVLVMYPGDRVDFDNLERQGLAPKDFEKIYMAATGKTLENKHEVEPDDAYPKKSSRQTTSKPRPMTAAEEKAAKKPAAKKPAAKEAAAEEEAAEEEAAEDNKDKAADDDNEDIIPPSDQPAS